MKFVITGSIGNISKPLGKMLIGADHDVSIITSNIEKIREIENLGAKALVGSVADETFLTNAFQGADAIYTMIPPKMDAVDWKQFIYQIADTYANAIIASGVKRIVNLSSIGAHLATGAGLISVYHHCEQKLNKLGSVEITHLRPGSFYYNFFGNVNMIKHMGVIGNNYAVPALPLTHPMDIASAAFDELSATSRSGKNVRYVVSDELSTDEIARILGTAVGKPELQWIRFSDEDALNGMIQAGLSPDVSKKLVEMGQAVQRGDSVSDYNLNKPKLSPSKFVDFANQEFAPAYKTVQ